MKKYLSNLTLRILCVFDVLFAKSFEVTTYFKDGKERDHTNFNSY